MIFPIGDTQVVGGHKPIFAYGFVALNIVIFGIQLTTPGNLYCDFAAIPQNILQGKDYHTLATNMFLHGGLGHLLGNMLFLWVFADNIEGTVGNLRFLFFYIAGGIIASMAHVYFASGIASTLGCCVPCVDACPSDAVLCEGYIPSLGASGALSAAMGAYLVMFPKSQIKIIVLLIFRKFFLPAWLVLGIWFISQIFSLRGTDEGVAWWAHIGGFVFGIAAGFYFKAFVNQKGFIDNGNGLV